MEKLEKTEAVERVIPRNDHQEMKKDTQEDKRDIPHQSFTPAIKLLGALNGLSRAPLL